jgi:hypothetical protein
LIPFKVTGFNPFLAVSYYSQISFFNDWLKKPELSARKFNRGDFLIQEVLSMAHDYLHTWAVRAIHQLEPKLGYGVTPIDKKNIEKYVFCHLLAEAVAVVGLDYWYLCTVNFNEVCDIGTMLSGLTVSYHEKFSKEYRRFNRNLDVQNPKFLESALKNFCGEYSFGYTLEDTQRSPLLLEWLRHEIQIGEPLRSYTRQWFSYLSSEPFKLSTKQLNTTVSLSEPWKRGLIREFSELLWAKIKKGVDGVSTPPFSPEEIWKAPKSKANDYRYVNIGSLESLSSAANEILKRPNREWNYAHFFYQYISTFVFDEFDPNLIGRLPELIRSMDFKKAHRVLRDQRRIEPDHREARDLFILASEY